MGLVVAMDNSQDAHKLSSSASLKRLLQFLIFNFQLNHTNETYFHYCYTQAALFY